MQNRHHTRSDGRRAALIAQVRNARDRIRSNTTQRRARGSGRRRRRRRKSGAAHSAPGTPPGGPFRP